MGRMGDKLDYVTPPEPPTPEPPTSMVNRIIAGACALAILGVYVYAIIDTHQRHGAEGTIEVARRGLSGTLVFGGLMAYRAITGRSFFALFRRKISN